MSEALESLNDEAQSLGLPDFWIKFQALGDILNATSQSICMSDENVGLGLGLANPMASTLPRDAFHGFVKWNPIFKDMGMENLLSAWVMARRSKEYRGKADAATRSLSYARIPVLCVALRHFSDSNVNETWCMFHDNLTKYLRFSLINYY